MQISLKMPSKKLCAILFIWTNHYHNYNQNTNCIASILVKMINYHFYLELFLALMRLQSERLESVQCIHKKLSNKFC